MGYTIQNVRATDDKAKRKRSLSDEQTAINSAKATSEFFHGVYQVISDDGEVIGYFVNGRRYKRLDTAMTR
jgi:hypothetical protein